MQQAWSSFEKVKLSSAAKGYNVFQTHADILQESNKSNDFMTFNDGRHSIVIIIETTVKADLFIYFYVFI